MDLTQQIPGDHLFIRSISHEGIRIVDHWYSGPLIISARHLITNWTATHVNQISESLLEPVFELAPDVVILGTGKQQHFLSAELMMVFYRHSIGIEVMNTPAACRTFNVLVSEERRVVAALIPQNM